MKRLSILVVLCVAIGALVVVRLWPHGGAEHAGALSHIELHPRDVRGMPVLWLGDNYDANHDGKSIMQLTSAELNDSPEFRDPRSGQLIKPDTKWYSMGYGTCVLPTPIPGNEQFGCPIPLQIDFYGVCNTPPLAGKSAMPRVRIRGVDAYEVSAGELWLETDDVTVKVDAWGKTADEGRAHAKQVVEDLIGANAEGSAFAKGVAFAPRTDAAVRQRCAQAATPVSTNTPRAPAVGIGPNITVGPPSLVGGNVNVPIMTAGIVDSWYSGASVHLRWDPAVFSFSSANNSGGVLTTPFCPSAVDGDGGGVEYSCASVSGAPVTVSGLVVTIILTPKTGCSALHLFTFAGADGGSALTGTYTINAADTRPQSNTYTDGTANPSGLTCTP